MLSVIEEGCVRDSIVLWIRHVSPRLGQLPCGVGGSIRTGRMVTSVRWSCRNSDGGRSRQMFFLFTAANASSWLRKEQLSGVACVASGSTLSLTQRTLIVPEERYPTYERVNNRYIRLSAEPRLHLQFWRNAVRVLAISEEGRRVEGSLVFIVSVAGTELNHRLEH